MVYDSLSLNYGGGIIPKHSKSKQYNGAGALAIGIGGTGIAALSRLKAKVYQQLEADDPSAAVKTYEHIQFLGIDSDEGTIGKGRGEGRLVLDEDFQSIHEDNLAAILTQKTPITNNHAMDWMDIEHIDRLLSPDGAGGIRQVGRYLLIKNAQKIRSAITSKINVARAGLGKAAMDVYIFAGISGGTGSGCFIDVCYIVRDVIKSMGIGGANIMGFFFLPDVVTSKPEVVDSQVIAYNNSNGYAAMKELDYLMSLKDANDYFEQNYGSFTIKTNSPPVDMCHLISAQKSDGSTFTNGFEYAVNVAADYVIAYLTDVSLNGVTAGSDGDLMTMRGLVSNVNRAVGGLKPQYGANLNYEVIGASNAEIPMSQIATYLAAQYYRLFQAKVGRTRPLPTKDKVQDFARQFGLSVDDVYDRLCTGSDPLNLPDMDLQSLRAYGPMTAGRLPEPWAKVGRDSWITRTAGAREGNMNALNSKVESFEYVKLNAAGADQSIAGRVFCRLYDLCRDPAAGPYYAAALLHNDYFDFDAFLAGEIKTAEGQKQDQELDRQDYFQRVVNLSAEYCRKPNKKNYALYKNSAIELCAYLNRLNECNDLIRTLQAARRELNNMYETYFRPLTDMLDRLDETFNENMHFLGSEKATESVEYTWRILELEDVRESIDEQAIRPLTDHAYVTQFMTSLLDNYPKWISMEENTISEYIQDYMSTVFQDQVNKTLDAFLREKYPEAAGNVGQLSNIISSKILTRVDRQAQPLFWREPSFDISDGNVVNFSTLSVPRASTSICDAADTFAKQQGGKYAVRKTGLNDRIFAVRLCCGVPLYAYHGVTLLKHDYDDSASLEAGIGSHLFAKTGRKTPDSRIGTFDWRSFLPTPMPYSNIPELVPEGKSRAAIYRAGLEHGIIRENGNDQELPIDDETTDDAKTQQLYFNILETPALAEQSCEYKLENFLTEDGLLDRSALSVELAKWTDLLACLHEPEAFEQNLETWRANGTLSAYFAAKPADCVLKTVPLRNNGHKDRKEQCRIDHFIHFPNLSKLVTSELAKIDELKSRIARLEEIQQEYENYRQQIREYCDLLFFRRLICKTSTGDLATRADDVITEIIAEYEQDHEKRVLKLCSKDMDDVKDYALYIGFENYRIRRAANKAPMPELLKWLEKRRKENRVAEDLDIPALFDERWNSETLGTFRERIAHEREDFQRDHIRFYRELIGAIRDIRKDFRSEFWNAAKNRLNGVVTQNTNTAAVPTPPTPQQPRVWTLYGGNEYLYVYEQYGTENAFRQSTQTWVPVTSAMQVYNNATGAWMPIAFGPDGKPILP